MPLFLRQDVAETPCRRRYIESPCRWQSWSDLCSKPLLRHSLMSSIHFAICAWCFNSIDIIAITPEIVLERFARFETSRCFYYYLIRGRWFDGYENKKSPTWEPNTRPHIGDFRYQIILGHSVAKSRKVLDIIFEELYFFNYAEIMPKHKQSSGMLILPEITSKFNIHVNAI